MLSYGQSDKNIYFVSFSNVCYLPIGQPSNLICWKLKIKSKGNPRSPEDQWLRR